MKLLIFTSNNRETRERLLGLTLGLEGLDSVELCGSREALARGLRQPTLLGSLALIAPADKEELDGIVSLGQLLSDVRTILILPDQDRDTISRGLLVRPHFLGFAEGNLSVLARLAARVSETGKWR